MQRNAWRYRTTALVVILLSFMAVETFGQTGFPPEGIKAARGRDPINPSNSAAVFNSGEFFKTWFEGDEESVFRIYAQIVTPDGQLVYQGGPEVLSTGDTHAVYPKTAATGDGNVVVCWRENAGAEDSWNIRMQKIDPQGELLWEEGGKTIRRFRGATRVGAYLEPDFDSGVVLVVYSRAEPDSSWIYALNEDGEIRRGWNENGVFIDSVSVSVYPIRGGGCWLVDYDRRVNRLTSDGVLRWEEDFEIEPPREGLGRSYYRFTDGIRLFTFFGFFNGSDYSFGITATDSSGEEVASDVLVDRHTEDLFEIISEAFVADDGKAYLLYSEFFLEGCCPQVREMPWIVCWDPLSEERFPWSEDGLQLPHEEHEGFISARNLDLHRLGETLLLSDDSNSYLAGSYKAYALNQEGEPAWDEQPKYFPIAREIRRHGGQSTCSSDDQVWVFSSSYMGCFGYDENGELTSGDSPVWIMPDYRYYPGWVGAQVMDDGGYSILGYSHNALFCQKLDINGELYYPLEGRALDFDWPLSSHPAESGRIGDRQWLWQYIDETSGQLAILDEDQNLAHNRRIRFPDGRLDWRSKSVYDNGIDQLIIVAEKGRYAYSLNSVNIQGEETAEIEYPASRLRHLDYWRDHGWLVVSETDCVTHIDLLDDELAEIWDVRAVLDGWGSNSYPTHGFQKEEDYIFAARLKNDSENDILWMKQATISAEGEIIASEDSARLFDDYYRSNLSWECFPAGGETFWFHGVTDRGSGVLQGIDGNGRRLLGGEGMRLGRSSIFNLDNNGGCWLLWDDYDSLRVTHLDRYGQPYRGIYPQNGFALHFNGRLGIREYKFYGADFDPQEDRLWLSMQRDYEILGYDMPLELRVQVFSDEWVSARRETNINHPKSFALSAYPNPFNATTTIHYSIPWSTDITLALYDIQGRLARELVNEKRSPGYYSLNYNGGSLGTGVYILSLTGENFQKTTKVCLIK